MLSKFSTWEWAYAYGYKCYFGLTVISFCPGRAISLIKPFEGGAYRPFLSAYSYGPLRHLRFRKSSVPIVIRKAITVVTIYLYLLYLLSSLACYLCYKGCVLHLFCSVNFMLVCIEARELLPRLLVRQFAVFKCSSSMPRVRGEANVGGKASFIVVGW